MTSEDAIDVVVADPKSHDTFVGGPTSTTPNIAGLPINLAGDVTVGVASSADLSAVVTGDVASLADLAMEFTGRVASLSDLC